MKKSDSILRQKYIDIEHGKNLEETELFIFRALSEYATYEQRLWNIFNESPQKVSQYDILLVPLTSKTMTLVFLGLCESWFHIDYKDPKSISEFEVLDSDFYLFKSDILGREFYDTALIPTTAKLDLTHLQSTITPQAYPCARENLNWAIRLVKKYGQVGAFIPREPGYSFLLMKRCKPAQYWLDLVNNEDFEGFVWSAKSRIWFEKGNLGI